MKKLLLAPDELAHLKVVLNDDLRKRMSDLRAMGMSTGQNELDQKTERYTLTKRLKDRLDGNDVDVNDEVANTIRWED